MTQQKKKIRIIKKNEEIPANNNVSPTTPLMRIISREDKLKQSSKSPQQVYPLTRYQSKITGRTTTWKTFSSKQHNQISAEIQWNNSIYLTLLKQNPDYFRDSNFFGSIINDDWPYEDVQHRRGTAKSPILTTTSATTNKKLDFKGHLNQLYVFYLNKDRNHNVFFYSQESMSFDGGIPQFNRCHPQNSVIIFLYINNKVQFYTNNSMFFQQKFDTYDAKQNKIKQHKVIMIFNLLLNVQPKDLKRISQIDHFKIALYKQLKEKQIDIDILINGIQRNYAENQIDVQHYFGQFLLKYLKRP